MVLNISQFRKDWQVFNMKIPILLVLLIPLFSSTKLRLRLPSLPPVLSELREIKEKFFAHGLNNIKFRSNINNKITPSTTAQTTTPTTTITTTTTPTTTTKKTNTGRKEMAVQSKKLVSLVRSFVKDMRDKTKDSKLVFPSFGYLLTNLV